MKTRNTLLVVAFCAVCVLATSASTAQAGLLWDVQFSDTGSNVQTGAAALGAAGDPAWNSLTTNSGSTTGLNDTAGANPITVSYSAGGSYTDNSGPFNPASTANLMSSYLYDFGASASPTFTVGGLAAGANFTLVVYGAGNVAGQGDTTINVNGSFFGSTTGADRILSNGPGDAYAIGTVTSNALGQLIVAVGNPNNYSAINGFQLYSSSTPEPCSFILSGLGAVGLLAAVRRRRKA